MIARALAGWLACAAGACVDLGYDAERFATADAPPPPDAGPDAAPGAIDATACVEEAVTPSGDGPQVNFVTLNVDSPMLSISAGDVVTWNNTDTMSHTVTQGVPGAPSGIDSGTIAPGGAWAYRFCDPRTVVYFCSTHPAQMNGFRIVVEP